MNIVSNCAGTPAHRRSGVCLAAHPCNACVAPSKRARVAIAAVLLLFGAAATYADTPTAESVDPSRQTREKMAVLHEQLAACLRTDKPVRECRSEMVVNCQAQLGSDCATIAGVVHGTDNRHRMHPMGATPATTPNP